jgi:DNA-binding MarR family transcriptional regulator
MAAGLIGASRTAVRAAPQVTRAAAVAYKRTMTEALSRRLKQEEFAGAAQEALLSVLVAAATLNDLMERVCAEHKVTRAQYNVLRILRGVYPQGHPRCEIACRMIDRAPDITRLLDRLEARRLVRRTRGSEDQRQTVTFITAKGLRLLASMEPRVDAEVGGALSRLRDDECRELSRLCAAIFEGATGE